MRLRAALIGLAVLLLAGVAVLRTRPDDRVQMPHASVTTIAKIPFGDGPGEIAQASGMHRWTPSVHPGMWGRRMPVDVDDRGRVHVLVNDWKTRSDLFVFSPRGELLRVTAMRTAGAFPYFRCGPHDVVWLADPFRLIKARSSDGTPLWEIGQRYVKDEHGQALRLKAKGVRFGQIHDLFAASNGDVLVLSEDPTVIRSFNAQGQPLHRFESHHSDGEQPGFHPVIASFSMIADRSGKVYSHFWGKRRAAGGFADLRLRVAANPKSPSQYTRRTIDLSQLEFIGGSQLLLMGVDAKGNLYFQYRYNPGGREVSYREWSGPMAIARAGSDNIAVKVFDIYEHYKPEMENVKQQSPAEGKKRRPFGIGDIIHVAPNGVIYLEVADATYYRIAKISILGE